MTAKLAAGSKAPAFNLHRNGEGHLSLASLRGKKFVLYFYPKDDTSGCTKEAVEFSALASDFAAAGVEVIGVSPDSVKSHDKFVAKYSLSVTLLADEKREAAEAWGVWVEKSMYGRKYMGVERTTFLIGADGRISRVWNKVKVAGHAQEVLEAARTL